MPPTNPYIPRKQFWRRAPPEAPSDPTAGAYLPTQSTLGSVLLIAGDLGGCVHLHPETCRKIAHGTCVTLRICSCPSVPVSPLLFILMRFSGCGSKKSSDATTTYGITLRACKFHTSPGYILLDACTTLPSPCYLCSQNSVSRRKH